MLNEFAFNFVYSLIYLLNKSPLVSDSHRVELPSIQWIIIDKVPMFPIQTGVEQMFQLYIAFLVWKKIEVS